MPVFSGKVGIREGDILDQERLTNGKRLLQDALASDEFIGAKVDDVRITTSPVPAGVGADQAKNTARWITVEFHVDLGDRATFGYRGNTVFTRSHLDELVEDQRVVGFGRDYVTAIRERIEQVTKARFNSVLLNYYRDGRDSMGYHADDEPELGENPVIASISLGAARRFVLKHNQTGEKHEIVLEHGSLLVMGGSCQHFWKHAIPKTAKPVRPRINLTFRHIHSKKPSTTKT